LHSKYIASPLAVVPEPLNLLVKLKGPFHPLRNENQVINLEHLSSAAIVLTWRYLAEPLQVSVMDGCRGLKPSCSFCDP
jgi:hypothetical protein